MLFPTPLPAPGDHRVLEEIDQLRIRLRDRVLTLPSERAAWLRQYLTADAVAASNSIEGIRVSTVDAVDIMDGERDVEVTEAEREETLAYQRMMTYLQTLHDAEDFHFGTGFLNALHWMLQGHRHTRHRPAGQWRAGPVYVTDARDPGVAAYTAPPAADVPALMAELVDWLETPDDTHPLVRAALAHLHLVCIHPWSDGNGRLSRSLQTLLIAREGVLAPEFSSIEAWLGRPGNTWEYYRELSRYGSTYRPEQDVSRWVRFNLLAYHQQAQTVGGLVERSRRIWSALQEFTTAAGLDDRTLSALHDVALTGRVRRSGYERAEGLSVQQAQRDLRDLVTTQVLQPVGRTRARYYVAGPQYPEPVLEIAHTPMTLTDPYAARA